MTYGILCANDMSLILAALGVEWGARAQTG